MGYKIVDMPKLQSPFVREHTPDGYCVTPVVEEGYEWVFDDDSVLAVEKMDGTSVSVLIENGVITGIWNRKSRVPFFNKGKRFIIEGLLNSFERGYIGMLTDGQHFGECIGPKIQGNPLHIDECLWIPFETYAQTKLVYRSWGKYQKTFDAISEWFKNIPSIFCSLREKGYVQAEGVVFTHPDGRMAKLRRDMFAWYEGRRH